MFYRDSLPLDLKSGLKMNFPYKIYIYNLPPALNADIVKELLNTDLISKGMMTSSGFGQEVFKTGKYDDISVRNTYQFALEIIMHQKMMASPYRTLDPDEADIFYVPAYTALRCIVKDKDCQSCLFNRYLSKLVSFLHQQPYFKEKRPHFSTIGKIHRDLANFDCPYLLYPVMKEINFFGIEKVLEEDMGENLLVNQAAQSIIVVPYPSYVHFTGKTASVTNFKYDRTVFALLPVAHSEESSISAKLANQFNGTTSMSYGKYFQDKKRGMYDVVHISTEGKTDDVKIRKTISWMTRSIFCLIPPGDSSTRREFYDAVLSGCIPVLFIKREIPYAFANSLDYSKFSVAIKQSDILDGMKVTDILKTVSPSVIKQLQYNLDLVSQRLQFSVMKANVPDAVDIALIELERLIKSQEKSKDGKKEKLL